MDEEALTEVFEEEALTEVFEEEALTEVFEEEALTEVFEEEALTEVFEEVFEDLSLDTGVRVPVTLAWLPRELRPLLTAVPEFKDEDQEYEAHEAAQVSWGVEVKRWLHEAAPVSRSTASERILELNAKLVVLLKVAAHLQTWRESLWETEWDTHTFPSWIRSRDASKHFDRIRLWHYRQTEKAKARRAAYDRKRLTAAKSAPDREAKLRAKKEYDRQRYARSKQH